MLKTGIEAYRDVEKATLSGRELEASILVKAAHLLKECRDRWNEPDRDEKLDKALRYNQRLWSLFQAELSRPDHPMPKNLREDLLSLSLFIDKRTFELMASPSPEKLDILIKINLNIAAGLRSKP
ncbi:MAG: flagellar biosynthesis regulator FlaF [Thermodesulfovibrionales bacterium]|nr:flagellar biosynthesis regulator FlaF [Thermodesulfovibrionales bacterium]